MNKLNVLALLCAPVITFTLVLIKKVFYGGSSQISTALGAFVFNYSRRLGGQIPGAEEMTTWAHLPALGHEQHPKNS